MQLRSVQGHCAVEGLHLRERGEAQAYNWLLADPPVVHAAVSSLVPQAGIWNNLRILSPSLLQSLIGSKSSDQLPRRGISTKRAGIIFHKVAQS